MYKLLIVEDDVKLMDTLSEVFEQKNIEVVKAENGKVGLEKVKSDKPHSILLDILMPVMGGIEMMEKLREMEEYKDTPVVLLTNVEPDSFILERIVQNPPAFYLVKGNSDIEDIADKVQATFDQAEDKAV